MSPNPRMKSPFFSVKHYGKERFIFKTIIPVSAEWGACHLSSKTKKPIECQYARTNICLKGSLKKQVSEN